MMLTDLADVARRTGYPVVELAGWRTRGHGQMSGTKSVICHHTGAVSDAGLPALIRDGHSSLAGPLAHFALGRDGTIYIVAAGLCWHNGWADKEPYDLPKYTNSWAIGIEAANNGTGEQWPSRQLDAYHKLTAELCRRYAIPVSDVRGHKEVQIGKIDPNLIDMDAARATVRALLDGDDMALTPDEIQAIAQAVWNVDVIPVGTDPNNPDWQAKTAAAYSVGHRKRLTSIEGKVDTLALALSATDARIQALNADLDPAEFADALVSVLPADLAQRLADELAARLAS